MAQDTNLYGPADIPPIPHEKLVWSRENFLGVGSFGVVYWGKYDDQDVAIKELREQKNFEEDAKAFYEMQARWDRERRRTLTERDPAPNCPLLVYAREIRRFKNFDHPNIVRYVGSTETTNGTPSLVVTERALGGSLCSIREQKEWAPLAEMTFLRILRDIAKGLDYLHNKGYIHGDLKPDNVLLSEPLLVGQGVARLRPEGRAMLADFGHSRRFRPLRLMNAATLTIRSDERVSGTERYMAPEAFEGAGNIAKLFAVDVFAFGMTVYELLMGKLPWQGEHLHDLVGDLRRGRRPDWGHTQVPEPYKELVKDCWQTNPSMRPDCRKILERLNRIAAPRSKPENVLWPQARPEGEKYWDRGAPRRPTGAPRLSTACQPGDSINDFREHLHSSDNPTLQPHSEERVLGYSGDDEMAQAQNGSESVEEQGGRETGVYQPLEDVSSEQSGVSESFGQIVGVSPGPPGVVFLSPDLATVADVAGP